MSRIDGHSAHRAAGADREGSFDVDVWWWSVNDVARQAASYEAVLSIEERARADRFRSRDLRTAYIAAHGAMRHILASYLASAPAALRFVIGANGKPALEAGVHFNLSHSGDLVLLGVSRGQSVGIDVEQHRAIEHDFAESVFTPTERTLIAARPPEARQASFFDLWCCKEAVLKEGGCGLQRSPATFDIDMSGVPPYRVRGFDLEADVRPALAVQPLELAPGFSAAAAFRANSHRFAVGCYRFV